MDSDEALCDPMASAGSHLSPLSLGALWRYYLRQEPDAVMLHVRFCGGGYG
jgi:hypothetical protein